MALYVYEILYILQSLMEKLEMEGLDFEETPEVLSG